MTDGIFNPYKEKKQKFKSPIDMDNPLETELPIQEKATIKLYTKKYIITLYINSTNQITDKIGEIIHYLTLTEPGHLLQNGITLIPLKTCYQCDKEETALKTKYGYVIVDITNINSDKKDSITDKAFQRISYMLYTLNQPKTLKKLGIEITMKGS